MKLFFFSWALDTVEAHHDVQLAAHFSQLTARDVTARRPLQGSPETTNIKQPPDSMNWNQ